MTTTTRAMPHDLSFVEENHDFTCNSIPDNNSGALMFTHVKRRPRNIIHHDRKHTEKTAACHATVRIVIAQAARIDWVFVVV